MRQSKIVIYYIIAYCYNVIHVSTLCVLHYYKAMRFLKRGHFPNVSGDI